MSIAHRSEILAPVFVLQRRRHGVARALWCRPMTHFSQEPSLLEARTSAPDGVLHLRGGGFVTGSMVEQAFARMRQGGAVPPHLLIDVRDVAGYESQALDRAHRLLRHAPQFGVRRIAFLASSAIVRNATALASSRVGVPLQAFDDELRARNWLGACIHAAAIEFAGDVGFAGQVAGSAPR